MRGNVEALHLRAASNSEAAETGGSSVIRVTFEFGAQCKQIVLAEFCSRNFVQGVKHAEAHGYAAAKPTGYWDVTTDVAGEFKRFALCSGEEFCRRLSNHST